MNIEVKDNIGLLERICKDTHMNPSQLIEYFLVITRSLYYDYEEQKNGGVETRPITEDNNNGNQDVRELPCPACIEAAAEKNEGLVPEYALLQRYSLAQLKTHLENNIHNQKEYVSVAIRASIHLYRPTYMHGFREIGL
jgi:hypothetical protein